MSKIGNNNIKDNRGLLGSLGYPLIMANSPDEAISLFLKSREMRERERERERGSMKNGNSSIEPIQKYLLMKYLHAII